MILVNLIPVAYGIFVVGFIVHAKKTGRWSS